jgi:hypothetical protein
MLAQPTSVYIDSPPLGKVSAGLAGLAGLADPASLARLGAWRGCSIRRGRARC